MELVRYFPSSAYLGAWSNIQDVPEQCSQASASKYGGKSWQVRVRCGCRKSARRHQKHPKKVYQGNGCHFIAILRDQETDSVNSRSNSRIKSAILGWYSGDRRVFPCTTAKTYIWLERIVPKQKSGRIQVPGASLVKKDLQYWYDHIVDQNWWEFDWGWVILKFVRSHVDVVRWPPSTWSPLRPLMEWIRWISPWVRSQTFCPPNRRRMWAACNMFRIHRESRFQRCRQLRKISRDNDQKTSRISASILLMVLELSAWPILEALWNRGRPFWKLDGRQIASIASNDGVYPSVLIIQVLEVNIQILEKA